ncbi:MAG: hypothetical protein ACI37T_04655 [Candidatus Gastranaerophilaceae bacterium]
MKKILLTAILLAGSYAIAAGNHPMDEMLKSWIGTPINDVIKYWGNPNDIEYERGQTEYEWKETSTRFIPGTQYQEKTKCERKLIVDVSGTVIYGTFEGNGCPFTTEGVKKWNKPKSK